jgi:hypothetical protein
VEKINQLIVSFDELNSINSVDSHETFLMIKLHAIENDEDLQQAIKTLSLKTHPAINYTLYEKTAEIERLAHVRIREIEVDAEAAKAKNKLEAKQIIAQSDFMRLLDILEKNTIEMEENALTSSKYTNAAASARRLYNKLNQAKNDFLNLEVKKEKGLFNLKDQCLTAIIDELPILQGYRGLNSALIGLVGVLRTLSTTGLDYVSTGSFGLFPAPANPASKINDLSESAQTLLISA